MDLSNRSGRPKHFFAQFGKECSGVYQQFSPEAAERVSSRVKPSAEVSDCRSRFLDSCRICVAAPRQIRRCPVPSSGKRAPPHHSSLKKLSRETLGTTKPPKSCLLSVLASLHHSSTVLMNSYSSSTPGFL